MARRHRPAPGADGRRSAARPRAGERVGEGASGPRRRSGRRPLGDGAVTARRAAGGDRPERRGHPAGARATARQHGAAARRARVASGPDSAPNGPPVQGARRLPGRATPPTSSGASGWWPSSSPAWPALDCWPSSDRPGSGKSSLVRAGLIPSLAAGVLPVAGGWRSVIETPRSRPGRRASGGGRCLRVRRPVRGDLHDRPRPCRAGRVRRRASSPTHAGRITSSSSPSAPTTSTDVPRFPSWPS